MNDIPEDVLLELRFLGEKSAIVRGGTPIDSPSRRAGEDFCNLVMRIMDEWGASLSDISDALGMPRNTLRARLARRGHVKNPPSQAPYKGTSSRKDSCKRGHDMSGDNVRIRPNGQRYCVPCNRLRASEYKNAAKEKPVMSDDFLRRDAVANYLVEHIRITLGGIPALTLDQNRRILNALGLLSLED